MGIVNHMGIVGTAFFISFAVLLVKLVVETVESFLLSFLIRDENDAEALRFVLGCVSSKMTGVPMPDRPEYIGAGAKKPRGRGEYRSR